MIKFVKIKKILRLLLKFGIKVKYKNDEAAGKCIVMMYAIKKPYARSASNKTRRQLIKNYYIRHSAHLVRMSDKKYPLNEYFVYCTLKVDIYVLHDVYIIYDFLLAI